MLRKLSVLLAFASLAGPAAAPGAVALGLANRQVARAPDRAPLRGRQPQGLIAPAGACAGQDAPGAPVAVQRQAMRCMVDFARRGAGLPALSNSAELDRSAGAKSADILRCGEFSHYACGQDFTYRMEVSGYLPARCWRAGENLAMGSGPTTTVRTIFGLWIHSPEHRRNILGDFSQFGVGLQIGELGGWRRAHVWTQHFGSHCGS